MCQILNRHWLQNHAEVRYCYQTPVVRFTWPVQCLHPQESWSYRSSEQDGNREFLCHACICFIYSLQKERIRKFEFLSIHVLAQRAHFIYLWFGIPWCLWLKSSHTAWNTGCNHKIFSCNYVLNLCFENWASLQIIMTQNCLLLASRKTMVTQELRDLLYTLYVFSVYPPQPTSSPLQIIHQR